MKRKFIGEAGKGEGVPNSVICRALFTLLFHFFFILHTLSQ